MKTICFFVLITFSSCATMKWKEKYATKNKIKIEKHYNTGNGFTVGGIPSESFKSTKEATRKEFKRKVNHVEKLFAIVPDSIRVNPGSTDSIYFNKYKIRYLKKHHLKTNAMIFKND